MSAALETEPGVELVADAEDATFSLPLSPLRSLNSFKDPEGIDPKEILKEFVRAVVPLTAFVVLYLGSILGKWILTFEMVVGLLHVIVGLAVFKVGLMKGLMPFGESIGVQLPQKVSTSMVFLVSFLLGVLVTFSEPGINSLQLVGDRLNQRGGDKDMPRSQALLMYILSPGQSIYLLIAVAIGVGFAASLGLLRLYYRISLKVFVFVSVVPLIVITFLCWEYDLDSMVGVSWDSGAITTGPATVPIVLSMGIGVAKTARQRATVTGGTNNKESELDGFGIVTLASLIPIFTVMAFGAICSMVVDDSDLLPPSDAAKDASTSVAEVSLAQNLLKQLWLSIRSVFPLGTFLVSVQAFLIKEPVQGAENRELAKGFLATLCGLFIFNIGLDYGSVPLGDDTGSVLPEALSGSSFEAFVAQQHLAWLGPLSVMFFGFVAGFMATVIDLEPCGLGETVEKLSNGEFTKTDLILSVATGVGFGIVLGFAKVIYSLELLRVLVIGYAIALVLTIFVDEGLCCIAWDSAGVTTGPVTVPLVLSMGIGICSKVDTIDGFGILACASVCPIISVLVAALLRTKVFKHKDARGNRRRRVLAATSAAIS